MKPLLNLPVAHALLVILLMVMAAPAAADPLRIGSKRFTESYILGEIVTAIARRAGAPDVQHRPGLGNSAILFAALQSGAIDLYPDYSGTVALELLGLKHVPPLAELNGHLARYGLAAGVALGFDNAYALGMPEAQAARLGYTRISDLQDAAKLRVGWSPEFLNRRDGWPALRAAYGLGALQVRSLEHGLAYDALAQGQVDLIDVYTTDPKVSRQGLRLLQDDLRVFPAYDALLVYRSDLPQRHPVAWTAIAGLQGTISADAMRDMNAAVEYAGRSFAEVAGH